MKENLYIAHKQLPHKTLRVHSARYTQCIHASSRKLNLSKDTHIETYKQLLPTHPFPKVELYMAVKCKNIYRVTNNVNRKKNHTHTHTHTHTHIHTRTHARMHVRTHTHTHAQAGTRARTHTHTHTRTHTRAHTHTHTHTHTELIL